MLLVDLTGMSLVGCISKKCTLLFVHHGHRYDKSLTGLTAMM